MKPRLYIFAKAPRMGKVKTRLAADAGNVHAWRIYRAMTAKVFREMQDPRWHTILYGTETNGQLIGDQGHVQGNGADNTRLKNDFGGLWPRHIPHQKNWLEQCRGDLSERMAMLFRTKGPVITVGTDIPAMKRTDIEAGFKALKHNAAVIGPAKDGGFYLIGLNAPSDTNLFGEIRWSHPKTRADMCAAIDGRIAFLRELEDVDDLAGYRRYCQSAAKGSKVK